MSAIKRHATQENCELLATRYEGGVFRTRRPVRMLVMTPQTTVGRKRTEVWRAERDWISWKLEVCQKIRKLMEKRLQSDVQECWEEVTKRIESSPGEKDSEAGARECWLFPDWVGDNGWSIQLVLSVHPKYKYWDQSEGNREEDNIGYLFDACWTPSDYTITRSVSICPLPLETNVPLTPRHKIINL